MGDTGWRKNRMATCHPDREYYAIGLCLDCYELQRPKRKQSVRVWRKKNAKKYGLTADEYEQKMSAAVSCAVCNRPFSSEDLLDPVLDHNHETKAVREVVHRRCNIAMGLLLDSVETCQAAVDYLRRHVK